MGKKNDKGYEVIEDKGSHKIVTDKFIKWKREGNVLSMLELNTEAINACAQGGVYGDTKYKDHTIKTISKVKKMGIAIIEFWVGKGALEPAMKYYEKLGLKFVVVREEPNGAHLCRLLL